MALIAEVTLSNNLILFEKTFEHSQDAYCVFEDFHYLTDPDDRTNYVFFWWMSGAEPEAFNVGLREDSTVTGFHDVVELKGRHLYRVETKGFPPEQPLVYPTFRENDVTEIESVRDSDGLHLKARFPDRDALSRLIESGKQIAGCRGQKAVRRKTGTQGRRRGAFFTHTETERSTLGRTRTRLLRDAESDESRRTRRRVRRFSSDALNAYTCRRQKARREPCRAHGNRWVGHLLKTLMSKHIR